MLPCGSSKLSESTTRWRPAGVSYETVSSRTDRAGRAGPPASGEEGNGECI